MGIKTCKLCGVFPANQTGSHIITHWLIKSCMNLGGSKFRDKELYFQYDLGIFESKMYVGRGINPENETLLKFTDYNNLTEDSFKEDNLFCYNCEKWFEKIESNFKTNIHDKLEICSTNELLFSGLYIPIIRVFFMIQLWRASVSKYNFNLNQKFQQKLKQKMLEFKDESTTSNLEISKFPITITFTKTENKKEPFNMVYFHKFSEIPYFVILNQYHIRFFQKESHLKSVENSFFGYTEIVPLKNSLNFCEKSTKIILLPTSKKDTIIKNIGNFAVNQLKEKLTTKIKIIFRKYTTIKASEDIVKIVLNELNNKCKTTGDYFSDDKLIESIEPLVSYLLINKRIKLKNLY